MNQKIIGAGILSFVSLTMLSAYTTVQNEVESDTSIRTDQMGQHENHGKHISEYTSNNRGGNADSVPANIKAAVDSIFGIGEDVTITEGHMTGMMGAQAEIVGAFDSYAYSISYAPTDGGEPVYDHKWVVQEEIADAGVKALENGTEVILEANHMPGMEGATATIESVEDTTVYIIDYQPTDGSKRVRNHKWMTDGGLSLVDMEVESSMNEGNVNFGQMKPYMSEMHPNLANQELNEWYKGMHGTGGSSQSNNFRGMGNSD